MDSDKQAQYELQLCNSVRNAAPLMKALRTVRSLGLNSWCIGAGALRSLIWDELHQFHHSSASGDMDVAYFDANMPLCKDAQLEQQLQSLMPETNWEVVNQARVHEWYASAFGLEVPALSSLDSGLATWPEYATCVGVYLDIDYTMHVIAPHGLNDLFEMRVRHNPERASFETFTQRVKHKRFAERWPMLSILGQQNQ